MSVKRFFVVGQIAGPNGEMWNVVPHGFESHEEAKKYLNANLACDPRNKLHIADGLEHECEKCGHVEYSPPAPAPEVVYKGRACGPSSRFCKTPKVDA